MITHFVSSLQNQCKEQATVTGCSSPVLLSMILLMNQIRMKLILLGTGVVLTMSIEKLWDLFSIMAILIIRTETILQQHSLSYGKWFLDTEDIKDLISIIVVISFGMISLIRQMVGVQNQVLRKRIMILLIM